MTVIRNNRVLWTIQILLAALYLFAGGFKLVAAAEQMVSPPGTPQLPTLFLRFIGLLEVLGAFGLILPWLTGIKPRLTPLAAWGLVIIMIGATVIGAISVINNPTGQNIGTTIFPFVAGVLAATVAAGRSRAVTHRYSPTA